MEAGRIVYEGWVYGVGEWQYSKVAKLLKSALETVEYTYLDGKLGVIYMRGQSAMFEEDEENLTATFDLLADQIEEGGKGHVLASKWSQEGELELGVYEFGPKTWEHRDVSVSA